MTPGQTSLQIRAPAVFSTRLEACGAPEIRFPQIRILPQFLRPCPARPIDGTHGSTTPKTRQTKTSQSLSRAQKSQAKIDASRIDARQTKEIRVTIGSSRVMSAAPSARYLIVDGDNQLRLIRRAQVEAIWRGDAHACEFGCSDLT